MNSQKSGSKSNPLLSIARAVLFAIIFSFILVDFAKACSVCRCGDDRFFINGAQRINQGNFIVLAQYFTTSKTNGLEDDFEAHDQHTFKALLLYGLTERITLLGSVPYSMNTIEEGGMTEENSGLSDPELTAIADLFESEEGDFELNASLGTRIPLGKSDATDEAGARLTQHLQTGTGAWGVAAGLQAASPLFVVPLFYSVGYQVFGSNSNDFRYGNVVLFNVGTQIPLTSTIRILAEANGRYADKDKEAGESDASSGGTVVYFSPGLRLSLPMSLALRGQVQIPVVENLFGVQDEKVNVQIGFSFSP